MKNVLQIYIAKLLWGLSEVLHHWCNGYTANRGPHCPIFSNQNFQPFCQFVTIIFAEIMKNGERTPSSYHASNVTNIKISVQTGTELSKIFRYSWQHFLCFIFFRAREEKIKHAFEYQAIKRTHHWNLASTAAFEAHWQSCAKEPGVGCSGFGCIEVSVNTPPQRWIRSTL